MRTKNKITSRIALSALAVFTALLLCFACNKNNKYKWVYYDETYCSDAWTFSTNNEVLKDNVVNYCNTKGIKIYDLEIYTDRDTEQPVTCYNKTGRRIKCKIKTGDLGKIRSLGFYE